MIYAIKIKPSVKIALLCFECDMKIFFCSNFDLTSLRSVQVFGYLPPYHVTLILGDNNSMKCEINFFEEVYVTHIYFRLFVFKLNDQNIRLCNVR